MKWIARLLTTTGDPPLGSPGPVYALLRAHDTPDGPEEVVADWLACGPEQARRVAASLNTHEGRKRYRAVPLRALSGEELEQVALWHTTLTLKGTAQGVRYAVSQQRRSVPRAFAPTLNQRSRCAEAFAPGLEVWTEDAEQGLALIRMLAPVRVTGMPSGLRPLVEAWGPGQLPGRLGNWPRARPLPGGAVLWAHADGLVEVWLGRGASVPVADLRVGGQFLHGPGEWRLRVSLLAQEDV